MIDALFSYGDIALSFGENVYALQDGMRVQCKALGCPLRANAIKLYGVGDIGFHTGNLTGNTFFAGAQNVGVRLVHLLNHRADGTGCQSHRGSQHLLAKIEVPKEAIKRIVELMIRSSGVKCVAFFRPVIHGGDCKGLLTRKVMKKCALRYAGFRAYLVNRRRGVALLSDAGYCRPEKPFARITQGRPFGGI